MTKKLSRIGEAVLETSQDLHRLGLMDDAMFETITVRHLGVGPLPAAAAISPAEIRALREGARMSQAAFARHLNLTTGMFRSWSGG